MIYIAYMIMQTTYINMLYKANELSILNVSRDRSFTATKSMETRKRFWHKKTLKVLA